MTAFVGDVLRRAAPRIAIAERRDFEQGRWWHLGVEPGRDGIPCGS
jgi:hypothetical protein